MSLLVWLPLNGDIHNQGIEDVEMAKGTYVSFTNNGILGSCATSSVSNNTIQITMPNLPKNFANGKKYTLTCWVKATGNASNGWVVHIGSNSCGLWWAKSTARWVWNENDNGKTFVNPTISSDYDNWHHLAVTVDKTVSGQITTHAYVDGSPSSGYETFTWDSSSQEQPTGDKIQIYPYYAYMNDVRIYDEELSPRQIAEIAKGLVLHYKLSSYGNENILPNSYTRNNIDWGNGNRSAIDQDETGDGMTVVKLTGSNADWQSRTFTSQSAQNYIPYSSIRNKTVTFSCWVKANKVVTLGVTFSLRTNSSSSRTKYFTGGNISPTTEWQRQSFTIDITDAKFAAGSGTVATTDRFFIELYNHTNDLIIWTKGWKLEYGDKMTPWMPNGVDPEYVNGGFNNDVEPDVSGYGHDGSRGGEEITYLTDTPRYSSCYNFALNAKSRIILPNILYENMPYGTVSLWLKPNMFKYWTHFLCIMNSYNWNATTNDFIIIATASNQNDSSATSATVNIDCCSFKKALTMTAGTWYHIAVVWDAVNYKIYMYVDGVLSATHNDASTKRLDTYRACHNNHFIGNGFASDTYRGDFDISDFRIYSTALSADQVKELYDTPISLDSNGTLFANEFVEE